MKRLALTLIALSLAVAPAVAQPKAGKAAPAPQKKVKVLTIEAIDVDADGVTRPLEPISVDEAARSSSLIRIRRDFIDLILKAAESV